MIFTLAVICIMAQFAYRRGYTRTNGKRVMKFLRAIVLCSAAIVLSGCAVGISRKGYKLPSGQPPEGVLDRPIAIQYERHYSTNDVIVLGTIRSYDTGFSIQCDEATVLDIFRKEGRILGADVVNITEDKPITVLENCYRAKAEFLRFKDRNRAVGLVSDSKTMHDLAVAGAEELLETEEPNPFIKKLRHDALRGDANAQLELGLDYEYGSGVDQDYAEAAKWYRLAADRRNPIAQNNLGRLYQYGLGGEDSYLSDYHAATFYKQAAEQGFAPAQSNFGYMCEYGLGVETNKVEAVTWFRRAAEQGYPDAMMNVGISYRDGDGVAPDPLIAYMWIECARRLAEQFPDDQAQSGISDTLNTLKQNMTPGQIKQGDLLANQWYENFRKTYPVPQ